MSGISCFCVLSRRDRAAVGALTSRLDTCHLFEIDLSQLINHEFDTRKKIIETNSLNKLI